MEDIESQKSNPRVMKGLSSLITVVAQCKDRKIFGQAEFNMEVNLEAGTSEKPGASQKPCNMYLTSSWVFSTGQKICPGLACVRLMPEQDRWDWMQRVESILRSLG